jgi:hypothetical protein
MKVRLQPTELRMDCGRVASATLENVLPCSLRVLLVVILGLGMWRRCVVGLFFNLVVRGRIKRRSATHANFDAGIRG